MLTSYFELFGYKLLLLIVEKCEVILMKTVYGTLRAP